MSILLRFSRIISSVFLAVLFASTMGTALAIEESDMDYGTDDAVPEQLQLAMTHDLKALGVMAKEKGVPILIMYSAEDCDFCRRLEAEVLGPMGLNSDDKQGVIVRKVMMDEYETLRDFSGTEQNAESFVIQQGVQVTPTLALVDSTGKALVPMIVGYQTPGLYASYLDKAIDVSRQILAKSTDLVLFNQPHHRAD